MHSILQDALAMTGFALSARCLSKFDTIQRICSLQSIVQQNIKFSG